MITEQQAVVDTKIWFYSNKAERIETTITSLPFVPQPETEVCVRCKGIKNPIAIKYLSLITEVIEIGEPAETVPAVIFKDDVGEKITAELIRKKSEPLKALKIANIFDEVGYKAVTEAKTKAVKLRTSIEKIEKEHLKGIKARHTSELKEVTDYTAELYKACREAQTDAETKLKVIDDARLEAANKLAEEQKAKTEGREAKMYELGMTFNGQMFIGHGRSFTKEQLHGYPDDFYDNFVVELEGMQMESGVTGVEARTPYNGSPFAKSTITDEQRNILNVFRSEGEFVIPVRKIPVFENTKYQRTLANGHVIFLTQGTIEADGFEVLNDRIMNSAMYLSVM